MDPSSNNNNPQYYPPPQQNPPTQQGYPPVNPYQPPQQYPPTQQGYPPANSYQSSQQGYPPANPYQYDQQQQQPQIPDSTQNLDQLNEGWFLCFMVALGIVVLVGFMGMIYGFSLLSYGGDFIFIGLLQAILNFSLIAFVVIQLLAMKDRDLKKAKIALIGFLGYLAINLLIQFLFFFLSSAPIDQFFVLMFWGLIFAVVYGSLTLIGSFKVYQLLNENQIKSESDIYQNQNQDQNQNYYQA